MKLQTCASIAAAAFLAVSLSACATAGATVKDLNRLVKTLQDDKSCDRVRDIDVGAGGGQLGGEGHATFKEHSECGAGHGSQSIVKPGAVVVPPAGATPPS